MVNHKLVRRRLMGLIRQAELKADSSHRYEVQLRNQGRAAAYRKALMFIELLRGEK